MACPQTDPGLFKYFWLAFSKAAFGKKKIITSLRPKEIFLPSVLMLIVKNVATYFVLFIRWKNVRNTISWPMGIQVGEHNTLRISEHSMKVQNNVNTVLFSLITNFLRCDILSATMFKIGKEVTGGTCACTTTTNIVLNVLKTRPLLGL